MAALNPALLQEQVTAAAERIISFPRHPRGHQGKLEVEDVFVVVACRGADGSRWFIDPAEIDADPLTFARKYVLIGERTDRGFMPVVDFLVRFLPVVAPQAAGWIARIRGLLPVLLLAAALAIAGVALAADGPPTTLVLEHEELTKLARTGLPDASLTYTTDRVIVRGRVKRAWVWWPIRMEAVFVREKGRVRLRVRDLKVRGRPQPGYIGAADERIAKLVDVESAAASVEIHQGETVEYSQELPP